MIESAFMGHEFDSQKVRPDTSTQTPGLIYDTLVSSCPDNGSTTPINGTLSLKQGLGLWTYSGRPTQNQPATFFSYQLMSFNSTAFVSDIPIRIGRRKKEADFARSRMGSTWLWRGRGLLGRTSNHLAL